MGIRPFLLDSFRNSWEYEDSLSPLLSFFFCVPKRRNKKKAPQPVLALRASLTSRRGRDAEKLGLRPQTVPASFPPPVCEARQDKWGREKEKSHWPAAEHRRGCRKRALHCLRRSRVCKAPAASRSTGYPACGGTRDTGGPFFGSFLWASKEMNRRMKRIPLAPEIVWQSDNRQQHPTHREPAAFRDKAQNPVSFLQLAGRK